MLLNFIKPIACDTILFYPLPFAGLAIAPNALRSTAGGLRPLSLNRFLRGDALAFVDACSRVGYEEAGLLVNIYDGELSNDLQHVRALGCYVCCNTIGSSVLP